MKQKPNSFRFIKNGYISILLLIVALGMEALIETKELARLTDQIYQHSYKVSNELREADGHIEKMRGLMNSVVLARSREELNALVDQINFLAAGTNENFDEVLEAFFGDKADVLEAQMQLNGWNLHRERVVQYVREDRYDEATSLHRNDGMVRADQLTESVGGLIESVRSDAETVMRRGQERQQKSRVLLIGTMVAVMLLASIIAVRIVNSEKEAKRELVASEQRLSLAIDNMAVGIFVFDEDGTIIEFNPLAERIFGYEAEEAQGRNVRMLLPPPISGALEADLRSYLDACQDEMMGIGSGSNGVRKNGESFPMSLRVGEIERAGQGPLFVASVNDLTEIKQLEDQLRQTQKMEAIGQLTGGIAHDFNNILGIVMGNLEFLQEEVADDPKILGRINKAIRGTERGANLTKKLLGFSRKGATESEVINVNGFIGSLHDLIAKSLTPSIKVEQHMAGDLWSVKIDPGDFEDAILNLALNARDAMPDGGNLVIETTNKIIDETYARANLDARAGEFVTISVSDNGEGMTDEIREKVFEPFYSTKEQGKGTGLGLSMVYGFVRRSSGHVKIYSEPGRGTTINLYLPRVQDTANGVRQQIDPIRNSVPSGDETILVVDDEVELADIAFAHLEGLGYKVLCALDGEQALEILKNDPGIDLLFSDIIMPGRFDGYKLASAASKMGHQAKVLLASGFTRRSEEYVIDEKSSVRGLTRDLLGKPYNRHELAAAVRQALDRGHDGQA